MTAAQDVENAGNGSDGNAALSYALVAMLYNANILGLSKDYAFKEGANTSSSRWDQITTLAKVLTRTHKHADGNTYDIWDAAQTILKYILTVAPNINADEVNSVTYKAPASS